jgi:excisionase family DNA binding protein
MNTAPEVPLLTVAEAAELLRIGRSLAYQLAAEYIRSGGVSGLPAVRFGTCLRVPRWALLELALTGRVVRLCDAPVPDLTEVPGDR